MSSEPIRSNHSYESVREILEGQRIPESYLEKALREHGHEEFPEAGLSDIGKDRLIQTAIDIYHSDVDLTPRKKESYNPKIALVKVGKKSTHWASLETSVMKEELKKVGRGIIKTITYPTLGIMCVLPTMIRKSCEGDDPLEFPGATPFIGSVIGNAILWISLTNNNPKLIPYVIGTQVITNTISGIYEYVRHVKNKAKENVPHGGKFN
jgi:hypothetical protein